MNSIHLNEHDANQGAQSSGEFLGMTGNSGWYLLGSGGATIMMVIFLWGILGVSLLLCLFIGIILCLGSLAYVFTLKNNKPEHYDTDFFESALVEAGLLDFTFGPRKRRPSNPFVGEEITFATSSDESKRATRKSAPQRAKQHSRSAAKNAATTNASSGVEKPVEKREEAITRATYEQLQDKLASTEEQLEEVLAESAED
ncbi:MAG: DUF4133 domain-containing protein [Nibricoccus sp.]